MEARHKALLAALEDLVSWVEGGKLQQKTIFLHLWILADCIRYA